MSSQHRSPNRPPSPPHVLMLGQLPPPYHGQAIATQVLFDHPWRDLEVTTLRMAYSDDMARVGRFSFGKVTHLWRLVRETRSALRKRPGTILFYPPASPNWLPFLRDVVFLSAVRQHAGKTVFIFHAGGLAAFVQSSRLRRWLGRAAYQKADMVLETSADEPSPHASFDARNWRAVAVSVDVPRLPRDNPKPDRPLRVLFVGSLQEGKGVLEVLRTAAVLRDRGHIGRFHFALAGAWFSTQFRSQALAEARRLGIEGSVEFLGEVTGDSKWLAYREANVFFFPTHFASESSPIVLKEALGAGLPIVSTAWRGVPAILSGYRGARVVPPRSPQAFADALLDLESRREEFAILGDEGRTHYEGRFTRHQFTETVRQALLAVAGAHAR